MPANLTSVWPEVIQPTAGSHTAISCGASCQTCTQTGWSASTLGPQHTHTHTHTHVRFWQRLTELWWATFMSSKATGWGISRSAQFLLGKATNMQACDFLHKVLSNSFFSPFIFFHPGNKTPPPSCLYSMCMWVFVCAKRTNVIAFCCSKGSRCQTPDWQMLAGLSWRFEHNPTTILYVCIFVCVCMTGAKEIDIAATLEHLRDQRPGMVQTKVTHTHLNLFFHAENLWWGRPGWHTAKITMSIYVLKILLSVMGSFH